MALAVLEQPAGDRVGVAVGGGCQGQPVGLEPCDRLGRQPRPDQVGREVGCRRDPDQARRPARAGPAPRAAPASRPCSSRPGRRGRRRPGPGPPGRPAPSRRSPDPRSGRTRPHGRGSRSGCRRARAPGSGAPAPPPSRPSCPSGSRGRRALRPAAGRAVEGEAVAVGQRQEVGGGRRHGRSILGGRNRIVTADRLPDRRAGTIVGRATALWAARFQGCPCPDARRAASSRRPCSSSSPGWTRTSSAGPRSTSPAPCGLPAGARSWPRPAARSSASCTPPGPGWCACRSTRTGCCATGRTAGRS